MLRYGLVIPLVLALSAHACAGDWPQILGPQRNGLAAGEKLLDQWPKDGPRTAWTAELGSGYSGVAVAGGKVIAFHRVGDQERIEAFDAATGKSLWQADFPANYRGGIDANLGPRCVPVIHEQQVYVFGADGDLHCVALADGKPRWSRSLYEDYRANRGYFGAGSTPIVVDGRLLVNVGGRGAGLVALDLKTGKTLWQATDEDASYASPTATSVNGFPQGLFVTRYNALLVDPKTGKTHKLLPFGKRGPTVNAATPILSGNKLFLTASYGVGAVRTTLGKEGATEIWSSDESLSSQYATPIEHKGYLYGIHGREDVGAAELRSIEAATGRVQWSKEGFGVAHAILADEKLLLQCVDGRLVLIAAAPREYRELASATIASDPLRALPALSNGRLYIRTTPAQGGKLMALVVAD